MGNPWGPVVDGPHQGAQYAFLTELPKSMREQGRFQRLRVMAGLVKDDGSYFIREFILPYCSRSSFGICDTDFTIAYNNADDFKVICFLRTAIAIRLLSLGGDLR